MNHVFHVSPGQLGERLVPTRSVCTVFQLILLFDIVPSEWLLRVQRLAVAWEFSVVHGTLACGSNNNRMSGLALGLQILHLISGDPAYVPARLPRKRSAESGPRLVAMKEEITEASP